VDSLNVEQLIGSVIQGALGGKRKRHKGVARFLTGGKSSFLNASTLLALGGIAWGVYETMTQSSSPAPASGQAPPPAPHPVASPPVVPPPLPGSAGAAPVVTPPPLPGSVNAAPAAVATASGAVSPEVLRVLRLTLSAARADGTLAPQEREAILAQARTVGAEALITAELDQPTPLEAIVGRSPGGRVAEDLYTLAFSIVRADEQVLDGERRYLDALAGHLGLDRTAIERLEQQAAARIAEAGGQ
jgi:uncharacterized membrane protein YebE (DUF533 family)